MTRWTLDLQRHKEAQRAFKLPVVHDVQFADSNGICQTLEGPVPYVKGDAIMTGLAGEHWPIAIDYFLTTYEPVPPTQTGSHGQYRKRKIIVWVMELKMAATVELSSGATLSGVAGDWLVQYEAGSFGIVEKKVFSMTYQIVE